MRSAPVCKWRATGWTRTARARLRPSIPSTASQRWRLGRPRCRLIAYALLLPLLLIACGSTAPKAPPAPETVRVLPPAELMQDCPRPAVDMSSNGALLQSLMSCQGQIIKCNLDRAALRQWAGAAK